MNLPPNSHHFQSFKAAMQFMTCMPAGSADDVPPSASNGMLIWYPMIGAVIGVILILGEWLAGPLPAFLQAALLVTLWAAVTGGLHLDGLADCADAWVGGLGSRERTLKIMEDPRCGAMAVIAVALTLILKTAALAAFHNWVMLLLIPTLARVMILPAFLWLPYAKECGLGGEIQQALTGRRKNVAMAIAAAGLLLPLLFVSLWLWLLLTAAAAVTFVLWRIAMNSRLQGFTGDCIGLLVELSELMLLLVFVSFELTV